MYSRLVRLLRHLGTRSKIWLSRYQETILGYFGFLKWMPRILRNLASLKAEQHDCPVTLEADSDATKPAPFPVFFINLAHRQDRREDVSLEFKKLGLDNVTRVDAIRNTNGALGCALSHIKTLNLLRGQDFSLAMICEDDVEFLSDINRLQKVLEEFQSIPALGVLCLAYRVRGPKLALTKELAISNNIQMAACYVVKPFAVDFLFASFTSSADKLSMGAPISVASIDQEWKTIQTNDVFFAVPATKFARQKESFSDIVGRVKKYD